MMHAMGQRKIRNRDRLRELGAEAVRGILLVGVILTASNSFAQIAPLPYRVLDAEYSKQLDKIIMISAEPNQLHIYDPVAKQDVGVVDLPLPPSSVSVGPGGLFAAVGHDAWISYVSLSPAQLEKNLPVQADVIDVVLAGNGYVYAFPRVDQWTDFRSVNIATGSDQPSRGIFRAGTFSQAASQWTLYIRRHYCPAKNFASRRISLLVNRLAPLLRENDLKMKCSAWLIVKDL